MVNADCEICNGLLQGNLKILYQDDQIFVALEQKPATAGHLIVGPKQHFTILEQVSDSLISKVGNIVNKASIALFESLNIQGTNVMISNGIPAGQKYNHFVVNIIPRNENDGINLAWQPKKLGEEEMATVELNVKEQTKKVGIIEKEPPKPIVIETRPERLEAPAAKPSGTDEEDEESYLLKHLRRVP